MQNWDDPLASNLGTSPAQHTIAAQPFDLEATATDVAPAQNADNSAEVDTGATGLEDIEMGAARIRVDDKKNH